jgi:hypothetical protein
VRGLWDDMAGKAAAYLRPRAQLKLLPTAADCLAVNRRAEKPFTAEG